MTIFPLPPFHPKSITHALQKERWPPGAASGWQIQMTDLYFGQLYKTYCRRIEYVCTKDTIIKATQCNGDKLSLFNNSKGNELQTPTRGVKVRTCATEWMRWGCSWKRLLSVTFFIFFILYYSQMHFKIWPLLICHLLYCRYLTWLSLCACTFCDTWSGVQTRTTCGENVHAPHKHLTHVF